MMVHSMHARQLARNQALAQRAGRHARKINQYVANTPLLRWLRISGDDGA
jgi:hypothetical protein